MQKFSSNTHSNLVQGMPFSYFSSPIYLDFAAYVLKRNGEDIVVWQDLIFPHDFPAMFMPQKKENRQHASMSLLTKEDVKSINDEGIKILINKLIGKEYYYETNHFLNPIGSLRTKINSFANNYEFKIVQNYSKDRVLEFYNFWKNQRDHESVTFNEAEEFFVFCLENLNKYSVKELYVEVDGKLVGIAWGAEHPKGGWVVLHLKVNYQYKGLSRFLYHKLSGLFIDHNELTLGTGAHDQGLIDYKEELGPSHTQEYFYVLTEGI